MAGNKVLTRNATTGQIDEQRSVNSTADTPLVNEIVSLGVGGIIPNGLLNTKATSAGAGDAAKIPVLDAAGRLDTSFMPVGIGADTAQIVASEALSAGDFVNVWNTAGNTRVRKADASTSGKEAHGFVLGAVANAATATVYFEGTNTAVTGQTGGVVFLDPANPGKATATVPTASNNISQIIGFAVSATAINFNYGTPIRLV